MYIKISSTSPILRLFFFFFNDTATTEIYTLSLHDALPICSWRPTATRQSASRSCRRAGKTSRSEEHTSELQSPCNLVCRLLLEKKKKYLYTQSKTVMGTHNQGHLYHTSLCCSYYVMRWCAV